MRPCSALLGKSPGLAALAASTIFATVAAQAQLLPDVFPPAVLGYGTDPGVTVRTRARPEFDSLGTRIGGALVHAQIEQSVGFDSNVTGGAPGRGGWLFRTSPSVLVSSTARRDPYGLYVSLDNTRYPGLPGQDQTDWTAGGGATIAVGEDRLTLGAAHLSLHQAPGDLDALPTDQPVAYQVDDARLGYAHALGRLTLEPSLDIAAWRFGGATIQGVPASQSYRNRDVIQGGLTMRYELAPQRDLVLALRGTDQLYVATPPGAVSPDSRSVAVLAGIETIDGLWRYRLLAGYERRGFEAGSYRPHGAVVAEADAIFTPGGMTTVTASLVRNIEDAAQEGVAGYTYTGGTLTVDYEWRRDVLLQASAGAQRADLLGGGAQTVLRAGIGATWLVNRRVRVTGTYGFGDTRATGGGASGLSGSFTRSLGLLTVRLGL